MTHQEKCHAKFMRRKNLLMGIKTHPHGYNTALTLVHDGINLRASIAKDTESTKNMLWRCNALPRTKNLAWLNAATVFDLYFLFPYRDIRKVCRLS